MKIVFAIICLVLLNQCSALTTAGWPCQSGNWTNTVQERCSAPVLTSLTK